MRERALPLPSVAATVSYSVTNPHWAWRRIIGDGPEAEALVELEAIMHELVLSNGLDQWACTLDDLRVYSVHGLSNIINTNTLSTGSNPTSWNKLLPLKVNILMWRLVNERLPTIINLDKRGMDLHSTRCPMCDEDQETELHIFGKCKVAVVLWNMVSNWWRCNSSLVLMGI